jgi:hypothetical protein
MLWSLVPGPPCDLGLHSLRRSARIPVVNKPKSLRPIDITPEGPGLLVETDAGDEVFLSIEQVALALWEVGYSVFTIPKITADLEDIDVVVGPEEPL